MVPKASSPRFGAARAPGDVVEQPGELGRRRSRGRSPARSSRAQLGSRPSLLQPLAQVRGAPVLPDDRVVRRARPVRAVPDERGLALVGDADGGDVARADAGLLERLARRTRAASARSLRRRARPSRAWERSGGIPSAPPCARRRRWSKTIARELVVPWSSASTCFTGISRDGASVGRTAILASGRGSIGPPLEWTGPTA